MRTTYQFVNERGFVVSAVPFHDYSAKVKSVALMPNNDPEDPSEDELRVTLEIREPC